MSTSAAKERLEASAYKCDVCGVILNKPYAQLNSGIVGLETKRDAPYGESIFISTNHLVNILSASDSQAEVFMKETRLFARDLKAYLNGVEVKIVFESVASTHLIARVIPQHELVYESAEACSTLYANLLAKYSAYDHLALSERFLKRIKPEVVRAKPVVSKVIFLNRSHPTRAAHLASHLYRNLISLDHFKIAEAAAAMIDTAQLREVETGIYSLQWAQSPVTTKPKAVQKILKRYVTVEKSASVELFYKNEQNARNITLKRWDESGFLAYTPRGYRRFLWKDVRGIGSPSSESVSREIIRMNRYPDGTLKVFRENLYRTRTVDVGS